MDFLDEISSNVGIDSEKIGDIAKDIAFPESQPESPLGYTPGSSAFMPYLTFK